MFKYMSEDRIEDVLINNQIRFTQACFFNDPFEMKPFIRGIMNEPDIIKKYGKELSTIIIEKIKDENILAVVEKKFYDTLNSHWGILSLTSNPKNILMWSHYANDHKGIVLEVDKNHKYFNKMDDKKKFFNYIHKVTYSLERPAQYLSDFNPEEFFLTKSIEWKYEDEYRAFKQLDKLDNPKDNNIFLSKFPKDLIISIYCGCNMSDKNRNYINTIVNNDKELSHVKIYNLELSDKYYSLIKTK